MFGKHVDAALIAAARKTKEEICGYIQNGEIVFVENVAEDKENSFVMRDVPDDVQAVFHSHPGGPFYPSKADMQQQLAMDVPWGIIAFDSHYHEVTWFGDGAPKAPLLGRGFQHGVTDCYEMVRDFYREVHNVHLNAVPREWSWWERETLYEDLLKDTGFISIQPHELLPGDGILASIRSRTSNHAAIYLGNDLILHHTTGKAGRDPSRLSIIEPATRWMSYMTKAVRYGKAEIDRTVGQGLR